MSSRSLAICVWINARKSMMMKERVEENDGHGLG
jgi:hypothetical protein